MRLLVIFLLLGAVGAQDKHWTEKTKAHADLQRYVGEWDAAMEWFAAPGGAPAKGRAQASIRSAFGGYFVEQTFRSPMFEGRQLLGFDTTEQRYVSVWVDSTSPYMSVGRGKAKDGGIEFVGDQPDRATGRKQKTWMVMRWANADQWTMTSYVALPDGTRQRQGVVTYTRKKG